MKRIAAIASVVFIMTGCGNQGMIKVNITNPLAIERSSETVEIPFAEITARIDGAEASGLIVTDSRGNEIPSQVIRNGGDRPVSLIFQPVIKAGGKAVYHVSAGNPQTYETMAYGRFVPERMDDYAWENDRIAFRIYGTALIAKDGPSNGLDVWVKRTGKMVIDRWYADYLAGKSSYHDDNGEGCDCYKVGRTLGAGAMAPFVEDSLRLGINFELYKTLDNGPIRTSFSLTYPPFAVDSLLVTETRIISLDAGSQFTKITEIYEGCGAGFTVAAGIVKRPEGTVLQSPAEAGTMAYRLDGGEAGITYIGTVFSTPAETVKENKDHLLMLTEYKPGIELTYYTGAGWSKWGFENNDSWTNLLKEFSQKLRNPLIVTLD